MIFLNVSHTWLLALFCPFYRERETVYLLSMFTTVTLAIGYYNRHIHSGDGDTTHV